MEDNYEFLEKTFMKAVKENNQGNHDKAFEYFREVLTHEPRMPEPRLEVATILFQRGELEEAEAQAREALEHLERGWRWLDDLTDAQLIAHACNLIAEILKARSVSDEVIGQGADVVRALWQEAGEFIERAADADPENHDVMVNYYSFKEARVPRVPK